jgi:hypothetical protein
MFGCPFLYDLCLSLDLSFHSITVPCASSREDENQWSRWSGSNAGAVLRMRCRLSRVQVGVCRLKRRWY